MAGYKIERVLGQGGFGLTYLAQDLQLDIEVAIKELIPPSLASRGDDHKVLPKSPAQQKDLDRFQRRIEQEALALLRVDHPSIARGFRLLHENNTLYQVTQYVPGLSFAELLARTRFFGDSVLTERNLRAILFPLLNALEALHSHQILHRDIKPENIIITDNGHPVLIDFGTAFMAHKEAPLVSVLTQGYSPYEQYSTAQSIGPPADIYALAAVMACALTGHPPPDAIERMQGEKPFSLQAQAKGLASEAFLRALDCALAVRANDRPQTVEEWRRMFDDADQPCGYASPAEAPPLPRSYAPTSSSAPLTSVTETVRDLGRAISGLFRGVITGSQASSVRKPLSETTPRTSPELLEHLAQQPSLDTPASRNLESQTEFEDGRSPVDCTVFARERVERTACGLLQVFLHAPKDLKKVQAAARKYDSQSKARGHRSLLLDAAVGESFEIQVDIEGFVLQHHHDTLLWTGQPTSASFSFCVPKHCAMGQHPGTVWISRNGIPLGRISFQITVVTDATDSLAVPVGNDARHYRSCFCSYASADRVEMLKRAQGIRAAGYETFIDVLELRPGDRWNPEIFAAISRCDLFVVIWSKNARQSKWVTKEARYALKCQQEKVRDLDFRPIPIEGPPIAPVPRALKGRHFNDKLLGSIRAAELECRNRAASRRTS